MKNRRRHFCVRRACVRIRLHMHASVATSFARRASRFGEKGFFRLTTKLSKKSGYYKGKKAVSPGWHEKKASSSSSSSSSSQRGRGKGGKGQFVLLDWKRPTYVVPKEALDKSGFDLKPYVAKSVLPPNNRVVRLLRRPRNNTTIIMVVASCASSSLNNVFRRGGFLCAKSSR